MIVRYAYAITAALLAGGATATMVMQQPLGAQVAQKEKQHGNDEQAPNEFGELVPDAEVNLHLRRS